MVLMHKKPSNGGDRGFTLIELLVVIAIIAVIASIMFPVYNEAQLRGKITSVHSDLKQIALALDMYRENCGGYPPVRSTCMYNSAVDYYQLPEELVRLRFISKSRIIDPFNNTKADYENDQGRTYKYLAIGWGYGNANSKSKFAMWIPKDYPKCEDECNYYYLNSKDKQIYCLGSNSPTRPPITWAVWSVGPSGDKLWATDDGAMLPVPKKYWYPQNKNGIIVRFSDGRHSQ